MAIAKKSTPARKSAAAKPAPKAAAKPTKTTTVDVEVDTVTAMSVLKQLSDALDALNAFKEMGGFEGVAFAAAKGSAANAPVELDEEDTRSLSITALRALAVKLGLDELKVKSGILDELEEKGFFAEADDDAEDEEDVEDDDAEDEEDEEEDDSEAEDDEDGDEDEPYTREELEEMSLKEIRAVAKEEGHAASATRGLDQEGLIVLILGEDDEDDDEEEDDEVEEIDEDQLREMPLDELKKFAKSLGIKVPARITQPKLVDLVLDEAAEDEE